MYKSVYNVLLYLGPGSTKTNQFSFEKSANLISCGRWRGRNQAASAVLLLFSLSISGLSGSEKDANFQGMEFWRYHYAHIVPRPTHQLPIQIFTRKMSEIWNKPCTYTPSKFRLFSPTVKDAPEQHKRSAQSDLKEEQREAGEGETSRNAIHSWLNAVPAI